MSKEIVTDWTTFKSFIVPKKLSIQYIDRGKFYEIFSLDGLVLFSTSIIKTDPENTDQQDFEANFKDGIQTNEKITQQVSITESVSDIIPAPDAFNFTATANSTTNHDFLLNEAYLVKGAAFLSPDAAYGDYIKAQLIDKDNVLGLGANTVIATPIPKLFVQATANSGPIQRFNASVSELPAAGLYIRIIYTNTALLNNVSVFINLNLYKRT